MNSLQNPQNPLLDFSDLPRFDAIRPEHVTPAIDALLQQARAVVNRHEAPMQQVTWDNFVQPLDDATEKLGRAWGVVGELKSVMFLLVLCAVFKENQQKVTKIYTS